MDGSRPDSAWPMDPSGATLPLLVWMSPAFPIGAFAYSHGLEWAAEAGSVRDRATLETWLCDLLRHGSLRNDLILSAAAWRAVSDEAADRAVAVAELALALQPSAERHLETVTQGNAFAAAIRDAWPCAALTWFERHWDGDIALPVAVGTATAGHAMPLSAVLEAYAVSFTTNLVSAAIRLSVVGQTDAQRIVAALLPALREQASSAIAASLDDIGGATFAADLASLRHETQYTRLFRS